MRNTLICTVGTSLLNNLKYCDDAAIQEAFKAQNWKQLSLLLLERSNTDRLCGAEINSIASIFDKGFLADRNRLIFLVSDTDDGRAMGNLLKLYFDYTRKTPDLTDSELQSFIKQAIAAAHQQKLIELPQLKQLQKILAYPTNREAPAGMY
ncbi:hypothetical protein [Limnospira platensis]|uniref:hypothetical protein n=1 Tax=Limnospira platensis TaxID=118562 RepID=UPI003D6DE778